MFTERKMKIIRKLVNERDKRDREDNIVIEGWRIGEENIKQNVEKLLKEKIGYQGIIETAQKRGAVVVAKVDTEYKIGIMKNKGMLAGTKIYVENDLSWKERKKQELINK